MKLPIWTFLVAVNCLVVTPAAAQVSGGIKGGLLLADFHSGGDDPEVQALSMRPDITVGGFVNVPSSSSVSAQVEIMFARRGARLEAGADRVDFQVDYIDISGLVRGTFGDGLVRGYVIGGATLALRVKAEQQFSQDGVETAVVDIGEDVHSADVRILGGAGVDFGQLILEGRYVHGLRNVIIGPNASPATTSLKNQAIEGLVGITF
jgi:hypothetical protein